MESYINQLEADNEQLRSMLAQMHLLEDEIKELKNYKDMIMFMKLNTYRIHHDKSNPNLGSGSLIQIQMLVYEESEEHKKHIKEIFNILKK